MATNFNNVTVRMSGWIYFAGILMILRGFSEAFLGITALVNQQYLFITDNALVITTTNTSAWGWIQIAVGLLLLAAGFSLLHGSTWARLFAIVFMGCAFLANLAFLGVFPLWSIVAMVIDIFVIYALVVRAEEPVIR